MTLPCACGCELARLVGDVYRNGRLRPERLLLCSTMCDTVKGAMVVVVVEPADFGVIPNALPCRSDMRAHGCLVPYCPEHGPCK
jgi:hypothetical protein